MLAVASESLADVSYLSSDSHLFEPAVDHCLELVVGLAACSFAPAGLRLHSAAAVGLVLATLVGPAAADLHYLARCLVAVRSLFVESSVVAAERLGVEHYRVAVGEGAVVFGVVEAVAGRVLET